MPAAGDWASPGNPLETGHAHLLILETPGTRPGFPLLPHHRRSADCHREKRVSRHKGKTPPFSRTTYYKGTKWNGVFWVHQLSFCVSKEREFYRRRENVWIES